MKTKLVTSLIIALFILTLLGAASFSFAYYYTDSVIGGNPDFSLVGTSTIIDNETQLIENTADSFFNGDKQTSQGTSRKMLKLGDDITLTADLFVSADCHIDLGGHTLTLNGHSITISHGYEGNFVLCDTGVQDGGGTTFFGSLLLSDSTSENFAKEKIYFDLLNAQQIVDIDITYTTTTGEGDNILTQDVTLDTSSADQNVQSSVDQIVIDVSLNDLFVANNLLYMAANALANQTEVLTRKSLGNLTKTATEGIYVFERGDFLSWTTGATSFVVGDIDLNKNFLRHGNYYVAFSSDNANVSSFGNVTLPPVGTTYTANLTATIFKQTIDGEEVVSEQEIANCTFPLSVINPADTANLANGANVLLDLYMNKYLRIDEFGNDVYEINTVIFLPKSILGIDYTYVPYSYNSTSGQYEQQGNAENPLVFLANEEYYVSTGESADAIVFAPDLDSKKLAAIPSFTTGGTTTSYTQKEYLISSDFSGTVQETDYTVASDFVNDHYGSTIVISNASGGNVGVNGFTTQQLFTDVSEYAEKGLKHVEYSIVNDTDNVYASIDRATTLASDSFNDPNYYMHVEAGKDPAMVVQTILLDATLTFEGDTAQASDDTTVNVQVPIQFRDIGTGETNVHGFLPYYSYLDQMIAQLTAGYTIESFSVPFSMGSHGPIICPGIAGDVGNAIVLTLHYGTTETVISSELVEATTPANAPTGFEDTLLMVAHKSYTTGLEAYLTAQGLSVDQLIAGGATWEFSINKNAILPANSQISIVYHYKLDANDDVWTLYYGDLITTGEEPNITYIAPDVNSYITNFTLAGILRNDNTGMPNTALYTWVYNNYTPTAGDTYAAGKNVFIDWLAKDTTFVYSTAAINVGSYQGMEYLSGMTSLNLANSSVSAADIENYIANMPSLTTLNLSGNGLADGTWLDALAGQSRIMHLDISNNSIREFSPLLNFGSLTRVDLFANIQYGIDSIFYGSGGLANLPVFNQLAERGVDVYNAYNLLYEKSNLANDYINLLGVQYQRKLATGADISTLYANLSTDVDHYGLSASYSYLISDNNRTTANVSGQSLAWSFSGGTSATDATAIALTYTFTLSGSVQTIVVEFPVKRI